MPIQATGKPKSGPLTHRQIAEQVGVSRQLVGFALRGEGRMTDEMRRQILEVARVNGYDEFSNGAARAMAARKHGKRAATGVLAVFFPATFEGKPLSSVPYFMPFFEGIEGEVIERGMDLMLCPLRAQGLPRLVREGHIDGVICLLTHRTPIAPLQELEIPIIHIGLATNRQSEIAGAPMLSMDVRGGGILAARHLIDLGHRRIAYLGFEGDGDQKTDTQNLEGVLDALREHNLPEDLSLIDMTLPGKTIQAGSDAMRQMLGGKAPAFTGLVCQNDLIGMGAIRVLHEAGLRVPEDISVVGFDDVSTQYAFEPALTSIRFPRHEMGRRAVQLLLELQDSNPSETMTSHEQMFPVELVVRDSTAQCRQ